MGWWEAAAANTGSRIVSILQLRLSVGCRRVRCAELFYFSLPFHTCIVKRREAPIPLQADGDLELLKALNNRRPVGRTQTAIMTDYSSLRTPHVQCGWQDGVITPNLEEEETAPDGRTRRLATASQCSSSSPVGPILSFFLSFFPSRRLKEK